MPSDPDIVRLEKIRQKVGTTPFSRAQWLCWFGQQDPLEIAKLGGEPLRELVDQLFFFAYPGHCYPTQVGMVDTGTRRDFLDWQEKIHEQIKRLKKGYPWVGTYEVQYSFSLPPKTMATTDPEFTCKSHFTKTPKASFQICQTLLAMGSRLRRCFHFDCKKFFIQKGRQRYCSKPCGQVHRTRQHRLRHGKDQGKKVKFQRTPKTKSL